MGWCGVRFTKVLAYGLYRLSHGQRLHLQLVVREIELLPPFEHSAPPLFELMIFIAGLTPSAHAHTHTTPLL